MKLWNIEIFLLDEAGNNTDASIFTKAVYNLHPSFENPIQSTSLHPPFLIVTGKVIHRKKADLKLVS
jgi:transcription initiation factor IIF auxiliary subunit